MQFVRHGPDIPERLLQLHEDKRVVFFCGAGISYPARLRGFSGLVDKLHQTRARRIPELSGIRTRFTVRMDHGIVIVCCAPRSVEMRRTRVGLLSHRYCAVSSNPLAKIGASGMIHCA